MRNTVDLTASIVTFHTDPGELASALSCVAKSRLGTSVYVVDNSPTDALRPIAEQGGADYLWNTANIGFGAAHNRALQTLDRRAPYHLVLNPDITFGAGVLEELHAFMEANPRVGWVMPRVTYPDGSEQRLCRRLASPLDLIGRRFFPGGWTMSRRRQDRYLCKDLDLSVVRNIPSLSGCFMFLRTEAIRDIGGFDERYFLYMEDFDYARRMGECWDTAYYPHVMICHRHERGSYRCWKLLGCHVRSAIRYYNKWGWIWDPGRGRINRRASTETPVFRLPERDSQFRSKKIEVGT